MEDKYSELFKLYYEKVFKSLRIIYDTLERYNNMAFSQKKMLKEADLIIQAILLKSLINSNELSIETLFELNKLSKYDSLLKPLKIKKQKELNQELVNAINDKISIALVEEPIFLKMCRYFDKMVAKIKESDDQSSAKIIINCTKSMLALIRNIDNESIENHIYDEDIKYIYEKLKK